MESEVLMTQPKNFCLWMGLIWAVPASAGCGWEGHPGFGIAIAGVIMMISTVAWTIHNHGLDQKQPADQRRT
jgi:hypothetical protein